jgi:hypothetical protein
MPPSLRRGEGFENEARAPVARGVPTRIEEDPARRDLVSSSHFGDSTEQPVNEVVDLTVGSQRGSHMGPPVSFCMNT